MNVEQRIEIERQIVIELMTQILAEGFRVRIENGGEEDFESNDIKLLTEEFHATDEEYINIVDAVSGDDKGWFWCIYGNDGYDVIADYSVSVAATKIADKLQPLLDKLEQEWS